MNATDFPESNVFIGPVADPIPAYEGTAYGGPADGAVLVITAWQPSPEDVAALAEGRPIYLAFVGGVVPAHYVTTDFNAAKRLQ